MVKYSRDQETEVPRRRICVVMAPPYSLLPLPCAGGEGFAAHGLTRLVLPSLASMAFDQHLGGDAGVVGAGDPEDALALHAMPADRECPTRRARTCGPCGGSR